MSNSNQGHIRRRGDSYQAIVYGGRDPVTGRKRYLRESAPTKEKAEEARKRLVDRADQGRVRIRKPWSRCCWIAGCLIADLKVSTREAHQGYIRRNIKPVFGQILVRDTGRRLHHAHTSSFTPGPTHPAGTATEPCSPPAAKTTSAVPGRARRHPVNSPEFAHGGERRVSETT